MKKFAALFLTLSLIPTAFAADYSTHHGWVSFYGPYPQAKRMANGQKFNAHRLTAASRTLPFGTKVAITSLRTRRHVVVEITDRGPRKTSRILDVTRAAAEQLGCVQEGVCHVAYQIVGSHG